MGGFGAGERECRKGGGDGRYERDGSGNPVVHELPAAIPCGWGAGANAWSVDGSVRIRELEGDGWIVEVG